MKINRLHAIIGFLLVIVPLLGFTGTFKNSFSILSGAVILYFAVCSIHLEISKKQKNKKHDSFVESRPRERSPRQKDATKTLEDKMKQSEPFVAEVPEEEKNNLLP